MSHASSSRATRGNSLSKRNKYVSKACEPCRQRRAKCDGKRPACSSCTARSVNCQYSTASDGRKPASKSYVQLLRDRIELLERVLRSHSIDVDVAVAQLQAEEVDALISEVNGQVDDVCSAFGGTLSLNESINFDQDGEAHYFGPTSGRLEFQDLNDPHHSKYLIPRSGSQDTSHGTGSYYSPKAQPYLTVLDIDAGLQAELIDMYFIWQNPWFPVLDEALFRSSQQQGDGRYFNPLLLYCVLAAGSRYSDRVEVRVDPDDAKSAGARFLHEADLILHHDIKAPTLATVQALAILVFVHCGQGSDAAAWLNQGTAHRLALNMGLNIDTTSVTGSDHVSPEEAALRRQIYWSLYCMDKLHATYSGRVCTMLDVQGSAMLPFITKEEENNSEVYLRSQRTITLLRLHATHSRILEKVLYAFYAPKPTHTGNRREPFFNAILVELKSWFYDLPVELRLESGNQPNTFPQAYTLHMVFHTTLLVLGNAVLAGNARATSLRARDAESLSKAASFECYESATNICVTAEKYRQVFGSFRRSALSATHCLLSAALVLIQVASTENDTARRKAAIANVDLCLCCLDELSISWDPARRIHRNLILLSDKKLGNYVVTTEQSASVQLPSVNELNPQFTFDGSQINGKGFLENNSLIGQDVVPTIMLDDAHSFLETSMSNTVPFHGIQYGEDLLEPMFTDSMSWRFYSTSY